MQREYAAANSVWDERKPRPVLRVKMVEGKESFWVEWVGPKKPMEPEQSKEEVVVLEEDESAPAYTPPSSLATVGSLLTVSYLHDGENGSDDGQDESGEGENERNGGECPVM